LIEFVGVSVVEQPDADCPNAGIVKEASSTAATEKEFGDIFGCNAKRNLFQKRWRKDRHRTYEERL